MNKVPQALIDEATRRGIVPGAVIVSTYGDTVTVKDQSGWMEANGGCLYINGGTNEVYRIPGDRWATVITPTGLQEGDACECSETMRDAVLEMAVDMGLLPKGHFCSDASPGWFNGRIVTFSRKAESFYAKEWLTPEAFIARMRATAGRPKPILIGDNTVKFHPNGDIAVGCTKVSYDILKAVYEQATKNR